MPITRRRRANPPEQPENTNHLAEQPEVVAEGPSQEPVAGVAQDGEKAQDSEAVHQPEQPESTPPPRAEPAPYPTLPPTHQAGTHTVHPSQMMQQMPMPSHGPINGDRLDRDRPDYISTIEGGRRTARGELFRRPPQPPTPPAIPATVSAPSLQAPTHEISLPLGNLLHLAYNPGYTGSDEARGALLQQLQNESKAGGRARCWSCGSMAVVYDRWNTRSKTFGEVGVAYCEICGVWSVM